MKNNLKLILGIIGGVVVVGSIAVAMIHFWDDLVEIVKALVALAEAGKELLQIVPEVDQGYGNAADNDEGRDEFDEIEA